MDPSETQQVSARCEATEVDAKGWDETGDQMWGRAVAITLEAPPQERIACLERLTAEIVSTTNAPDSGLRPWNCTLHDGTDGSRIFRSGIGVALVIDPDGRLWRGRSIEDFHTTYIITPNSCEIETMTPDYSAMREYLPR